MQHEGRNLATIMATIMARILVLGTVLLAQTAWSQDVATDPPADPEIELPAAPPSADFDANGRIDLDDLALLRQAMGGSDLSFDLNSSGGVDVGDLFRFADAVTEPLPVDLVPADPLADPPGYTFRSTRQQLILSMPGYVVRIRHGMPFGISSLKLRGQRTDFAHEALPLADWEWVQYRAPGLGERWYKLMEMDWGTPEVQSFPDRLEAVYHLPVAREGIGAEVRYVFLAQATSFHVTYTLFNGSSRALSAVYFMLGLPGFTNHGYITRVASAREQRLPKWPFKAFLAEAEARDLAEYQLLRHDVRAGISEGLKGSVQLRDGDNDYRLSSYYLAESSITSAYSAHTNKPRYLTSHLYATIGELPSHQSRSVTIHHVLSGP